ncbi:hypothetical protein MJT46_005876 [Ovis ammon polii x Ovis aries]|nr:hypothetical protein MJT46_005876 [Ovis ammon polii x Ovis aries]
MARWLTLYTFSVRARAESWTVSFFATALWHAESWSPNQESNLCPLQQEHGVLTNGPSGFFVMLELRYSYKLNSLNLDGKFGLTQGASSIKASILCETKVASHKALALLCCAVNKQVRSNVAALFPLPSVCAGAAASIWQHLNVDSHHYGGVIHI